jgi:hypothetical protein
MRLFSSSTKTPLSTGETMIDVILFYFFVIFYLCSVVMEFFPCRGAHMVKFEKELV